MNGTPLYFAGVLSFSNSAIGGHRTKRNQTSPHFRREPDLKRMYTICGSVPRTWSQKLQIFGWFYDDYLRKNELLTNRKN